jgi:hypothetical protein
MVYGSVVLWFCGSRVMGYGFWVFGFGFSLSLGKEDFTT